MKQSEYMALYKQYDSEEFADKFHYDGDDLGALYTPEQTCFRVWAPVAAKVTLCLYEQGEGGACLGRHEMQSMNRGVWGISLAGDYEGIYYTYLVQNGDETQETQDIYGKACGVNGKRSMVINLRKTDPKGWQEDRFAGRGRVSPSIYELHVKDFSSDPHSGVREAYQGKYLAFTEEETSLDGEGAFETGISYLKKLGVSYIHLLPVFDFISVDESRSSKDQFNWGYDPLNYNVPEGSYATDAFDGHVRIQEFKRMVQAIHRAGMGVVMDMVYNHTAQGEDSSFQKTVPYYYYRFEEDGSWANGSVCGNDTASERYMYRKFMKESVCYWAKEYHIDGFRFDLMGLHDTETMNQIREALNELPGGEEILMYGEPWMGGPSPMRAGSVPAVKQNIGAFHEGISVFNDDTRDAIKGSVFKETVPGFVNGDLTQKEKLPSCVLAWCDGKGGYEPAHPGQCIAYVSAHDNYTLWDKLHFTQYPKETGARDFYRRDEELLQMNRMAAGIVMTSLGIPFFQAGEEFARTKNGVGDSYRSPSEINQLDWNRAQEFEDLTAYYKGLLTVREHFRIFSSREKSSVESFTFLETGREDAVMFTVRGTEAKEDWWKELLIIYYGGEEDAEFSLPEGTWTLLCDGVQCLPEGMGNCAEKRNVPKKSVLIFGR